MENNENVTKEESISKKSARPTLLRGHWRTVALLLNIYDIVVINLSYYLALWLRFDCKASAIRPDFLETWMRFAPIYTAFDSLTA